MKRTDNKPGQYIRKLFSLTFVQVSYAIARTAIVSFLFIGVILILTAGLSQAREVKNGQRSDPTGFSSASLKTIIVGDYYPYTFVNDKGIPDGFSVDIAKAVVRVMDLKLEIKVDTWEHATKALANGTIDLLPMMAASPGREQFFDFSVPHTIAYDAIFSRNEGQRIRFLKDLADKTVIVMNKDAAHDYLLSSGMAARMKLVLVDSLPDALRALAVGKGDAALMPKLVGVVIMKKLNLTNLDPSPVVIDDYNRPFCFAVKEGNQFLLERLCQGLCIIKTTGQYQEIYKKWFRALEPPGLSWGTVIKYIAGIIAVFLLIGSGLILWTVSLRKQVTSRTENFEKEIQGRKKIEEALRESEERYRTAIEQSNDGIALVKGDQHIFVNKKMVEIFGYDRPEEIIGQPVALLIHTDDRERVIDINRRRQKGEAVPQKYEFKGQRKNGEPIYIEVSATKTTYQGEVVSLAYLRDITDRKQAEEALKTLSLKDALTGLYNRRGFFTLAEQGLKAAQRMGTKMFLIFGDLDNLKGINDTLGHKEGDQALMDTSQILKETFRESDIIARIGGDEFVILAMNSFETSAEKLIDRFEKVLNDHPLQTKRSYKLSMSFGIACFDPQKPCSIDVLIAQADKLMYENKQKKGG